MIYLLIAHGIILFMSTIIFYTEYQCGYRPGILCIIWLSIFNWMTTLLFGIFVIGNYE